MNHQKALADAIKNLADSEEKKDECFFKMEVSPKKTKVNGRGSVPDILALIVVGLSKTVYKICDCDARLINVFMEAMDLVFKRLTEKNSDGNTSSS